jgi:hypothetical protein
LSLKGVTFSHLIGFGENELPHTYTYTINNTLTVLNQTPSPPLGVRFAAWIRLSPSLPLEYRAIISIVCPSHLDLSSSIHLVHCITHTTRDGTGRYTRESRWIREHCLSLPIDRVNSRKWHLSNRSLGRVGMRPSYRRRRI